MFTQRNLLIAFVSLLLCLPLLVGKVNPLVTFAFALVIYGALFTQIQRVWPAKPAAAQPAQEKDLEGGDD